MTKKNFEMKHGKKMEDGEKEKGRLKNCRSNLAKSDIENRREKQSK